MHMARGASIQESFATCAGCCDQRSLSTMAVTAEDRSSLLPKCLGSLLPTPKPSLLYDALLTPNFAVTRRGVEEWKKVFGLRRGPAQLPLVVSAVNMVAGCLHEFQLSLVGRDLWNNCCNFWS